MGWLDSLADFFRSASGPTGGSGEGGSRGFGELENEIRAPAREPIDWGGGFKAFGKELAPGIGAAATGGLLNLMMPGSNAQVIGTDPRTTAGRGAEDLRLQAAQTANTQLQRSFTDPYGALSPEEQERIRKTSRSADAARGALETGGSAYRETTALSDANRQRTQDLYGQVGTLTGGYTPLAVNVVPGIKNPWAEILAGVLAPSVGKGFGAVANKWWI